MKQKFKVLFLVLCLFSSFAISNAIVGSERNELIHDAVEANARTGGPVEIMPPQPRNLL
ncbi:hypothetical protein [Sporosarcina jiandibaonis]|uniref:hypothetical protein n=1 Tax=Sporosarcina jiandibaonis TaxID=2715535 RepID=UPI001555FE72|nr:hypothetical protein [Sporosarcina jiandibaonis]